MLTSERFIGKEDISRILLVNSFWISTLIDLPNDEQLQQALLSLIKAWFTGSQKRFFAEDYERQYVSLALQNLSKLYQRRTLAFFYEPLYHDFI